MKALALVVAAVVLLGAGCSGDTTKPPATAPVLAANDSPAHAAQRLVQAYDSEQSSSYVDMFTKDFTFEFSAGMDPSLAAEYATGWVKNDESESSSHLFHGYSSAGTTLSASSAIDLRFANTEPTDDPTSGDPSTHKTLVTRVDGSILIPGTGTSGGGKGGGPDDGSYTYVISNNLNAFYLVRGDKALSLDSGQPADTSHWYVYRWVDLTNAPVLSARRPDVVTVTWASVRAAYRATSNPSLAANETPQGAIARLIGSYERKLPDEYGGMFAGDFTYEFSTSTDPVLVQQYSTGWFKSDEKQSSLHLFQGYTPPGGATLPAATGISIVLAISTPTDDNTSGVDPATHKVLATRVDGSITVPQAGSEPLTYVITNNYNVFYLVRGDVAAGLDATQGADAHHWYIHRWVDLSEAYSGSGSRLLAQVSTWGRLKAVYH